jgi:hypothetical protein
LLQVVLERLRKAFRQMVERGQGRRFARTFSSARAKHSRAATITKASSSPLQGANDAEGKAGDLVIALEGFDRHQAPNGI